jgi:hypothetical protein
MTQMYPLAPVPPTCPARQTQTQSTAGPPSLPLAELMPEISFASSGSVEATIPLVGWTYLQRVRELLRALHSHKAVQNRKLFYDDYVALLLLSYYNPVIQGLRHIVQLSDLKKVRQQLGVTHASQGSLSEASQVFDPKLLANLFMTLLEQANASDTPRRPEGLPADIALIAVDGTLLQAVGRMVWALWHKNHQNAMKLHVHYDVLRGVPVCIDLTTGNGDEKESLGFNLESGRLYIVDRGYRDYGLYAKITAQGSSFVARLANNAKMEVLETRALTDADRKAGVLSDEIVCLGHEKTENRMPRIRVVHVRVKNPPSRNLKPKVAKVDGKTKIIRTHEEEFDALLVTDRMDLTAEVIALLYRFRWQVELFFRWFKCVLGFRHLFAESPNGVLIQIYVALIAGLLVTLYSGLRANRYTFAMICFYLQGLASREELLAYLEKAKLKAAKAAR